MVWQATAYLGATSCSDVKRRLENNIFSTIGKRPIDEIQAPELLQTIRKIEARGARSCTPRIAGVRARLPQWHSHRAVHTQFIHRLTRSLTPHKKQHQAAVRPEELRNCYE